MIAAFIFAEFAMFLAPYQRQLISVTLLAVFSTAAFAAGDIQRGNALTYTCSGCHGIEQYKNAYPQYNVPKIAGQNYEYLLAALKGYRAEERKHPTMQAQAQSFSEQDLEDIAMYLASLSEKK
jgi:cytochrome c553